MVLCESGDAKVKIQLFPKTQTALCIPGNGIVERTTSLWPGIHGRPRSHAYRRCNVRCCIYGCIWPGHCTHDDICCVFRRQTEREIPVGCTTHTADTFIAFRHFDGCSRTWPGYPLSFARGTGCNTRSINRNKLPLVAHNFQNRNHL